MEPMDINGLIEYLKREKKLIWKWLIIAMEKEA